MKSRVFLALAMLLALSDRVEATLVADLRDDFENGTIEGQLASFPATTNGSWLYVKSDTANPTSGGSNLVTLQWSTAGSIFRNPGDINLEPQAGIKGAIALDEIFFHPKSSTQRFGVARWISDTATPIFINGHVRDLDAGGGDGVTFQIFVDGVSVFNPGVVNGSTSSFGLNATVNPGSFVDFVIGPNGFADFDSTGLAAAISVPEPSLGAFGLAGLCAFAYYRCRAR